VKLQHLSASRIKTFQKCELEYFAKYDLGITEDFTHPLTIMGKAYHKVFEVATQAIMNGNHSAWEDPYHFIDPAIRKYAVEPKLKEILLELTKNAIDWGYFRKVPSQCHGVEISFSEMLPDETLVVGYIDRLDLMTGGRADIIDLKTQKRKFTEGQLENNWQADIYNWALRKLHPDVTGDVTVSFWVVRHHVQRVTRTMDDAKRTEERLLEMAKEIRGCTEPEFTTSALCNWCLYKNECPSRNENLKQRFKRKVG
jgi:RecB family exonuclease